MKNLYLPNNQRGYPHIIHIYPYIYIYQVARKMKIH